ncbi:MAG: ferritin [Chitinivibrionales bacterium]|nr:ferritin [Chitinivibrionales bacterium]
MLSQKMQAALNGQVNKEMYSAYLYMAMSAHSAEVGLKGFANWLMVQYHEEMLHAMKIYEFVQARGGSVELQAIEQPPAEWKNPLDMFENVLKHEQFVTKSINDLVDLAREEHDHASDIFLQWYVTEQVEEEESANDIITQLKLTGDNPQGIMMIDKDLAQRMTTVPTDFSKGIEAAMKAAGEG